MCSIRNNKMQFNANVPSKYIQIVQGNGVRKLRYETVKCGFEANITLFNGNSGLV